LPEDLFIERCRNILFHFVLIAYKIDKFYYTGKCSIVRKSLTGLAAVFLLVSCKSKDDVVNPSPTTTTSSDVDTAKATAIINADTVQQTIAGFGGADIIDWTGDLTADQRVTAFSPTTGIGLSIVRVRVPVDSSEFSQAKATIDACKSYGGMAIATAWSAPASMKTNDSTIGGTIKPSSYSAYAAYLRAFNTASGGLAAISPTNEPNIVVTYESMEMTAPEVADFVAAEGDSCGAPVMAPEPFNMDQTYIDTYLSNAAAKSKTSFICGHIYGATPYVLAVDKPVWMTEHYINSNISGDDWPNAMAAAKEINDCMNAGWSAYIWWYIRRSYGPISESGDIQKLGYAMAQYARYVRPGFTKISCTENPYNGIYATAYKDSSKIVIVVINQNSSGIYQPFNLNGVTVSGFTGYTTTSSSNLVSDSLSVSGSNFGVTLPAMSLTTMVSN
jgi:glucuronoarabinoxylan endo-1,4-beta-xylanase